VREVRSLGRDPAAFTIRTVPGLVRRCTRDPWEGFRGAAKQIPELALQPPGIAAMKPANAAPYARTPSRVRAS
jgi:hypothetical protein